MVDPLSQRFVGASMPGDMAALLTFYMDPGQFID